MRLHWTTASETNNAGFTVEHAAGLDGFSTIGFVDGSGTSDESRAYHFDVPALAPGEHHFRLRQIDFDGGFSFSPTIDVWVDAETPMMVSAAFPNPFNPRTQFTVALQMAQRVHIALYNVLGGRVVDLHDGFLEAGRTHHFTVDAAGLPSGLYLVRVEGDTFRAVQPVTLLK